MHCVSTAHLHYLITQYGNNVDNKLLRVLPGIEILEQGVKVHFFRALKWSYLQIFEAFLSINAVRLTAVNIAVATITSTVTISMQSKELIQSWLNSEVHI